MNYEAPVEHENNQNITTDAEMSRSTLSKMEKAKLERLRSKDKRAKSKEENKAI